MKSQKNSISHSLSVLDRMGKHSSRNTYRINFGLIYIGKSPKKLDWGMMIKMAVVSPNLQYYTPLFYQIT